MKVLFIDDEQLIRRGFQTLIDWSSFGFTHILEADNGSSGITLIKEESPDLVLLDIRMPDMDGIELCAQVRSFGYKGRIIIISGYSDFSYAKSALTHGVTEYLLKPVDINELKSAIGKALRESLKENLVSFYELQSLETPKMAILKSIFTGKIAYSVELEQQWHLNFEHHFQLTSISLLKVGTITMEFSEQVLKNMKHTLYVILEDILFILTLTPQDHIQLNNKIKDLLNSTPPGNLFIVYSHSISDPSRLSSEYNELISIHRNQFFYYTPDGIYSLTEKTNRLAPDFNLLNNVTNTVTALLSSSKNDIDNLLIQLTDQLKYRKSPTDVTAMILSNYYQQILTIIINYYPRLEIILPSQYILMNQLGNMNYLYEYIAYLKKILYQACNSIQESNRERPCQSIQAYIDANLSSSLKLEEIAELFGYNSTYLGKLFKKETGSSFNTYLNEKRINYAKTLLMKKVSVTEAAAKAGYSNFNYFTMIFKTQVGCTPSEYRSQHNK